jgi:hypothetical protein
MAKARNAVPSTGYFVKVLHFFLFFSFAAAGGLSCSACDVCSRERMSSGGALAGDYCVCSCGAWSCRQGSIDIISSVRFRVAGEKGRVLCTGNTNAGDFHMAAGIENAGLNSAQPFRGCITCDWLTSHTLYS